MNVFGIEVRVKLAASGTFWHLKSKTDRARYRVDYVASVHRVYCRELRDYAWRLILGRLQITFAKPEGQGEGQ